MIIFSDKPKKITFNYAQDFILPFGKFIGDSLSDLRNILGGLSYLDWLLSQDWLKGDLKLNLEIFMLDDEVQEELVSDQEELKEELNKK